MPNVNFPDEDVRRSFLINDCEFVTGCIRSGLKRHEVRYFKRKYRFEEIAYAAREAFPNPARSNWFLYKHFESVRRKVKLQIFLPFLICLFFLLLSL